MSRYLTAFVIIALIVGVFLSVGPPEGMVASAQHSTGNSQAKDVAAQADEVLEADPYNRMALLWAMQRSGYESGPERGRELYYMKCWICHSDYARAAEPSAGIPTLRGLFDRPTLMNGQPVNNDTVAAWIRAGSPRMPAYTQTGLSDKDMQDLLAFLRECGPERTSPTDAGCFDTHDPPPNPLYRLPLQVHE